MTRQEVIDKFKSELSKESIIRTTYYHDNVVSRVEDTRYPAEMLHFRREVIEAALSMLEEQYDL